MALNLDRRHFLGLAGAGAGAAALTCLRRPVHRRPRGRDRVPPTSTSAGSSPQPRSISGPTTRASPRTWKRPSSRSSTPSSRRSRSTWSPPGRTTRKSPRSSRPSQAAKSGLPGLVVLSDVWWFRYYSNGNIIPLDSLIKQLDIKVDDFQKSLVADYQYEDKQWALPYGRSTPLFYYNKDHFKAAGLPDRAPKTWQEFAEWAPKLEGQLRRPVRLHLPGPGRLRRLDAAEQPVGLGRQLVQRLDVQLRFRRVGRRPAVGPGLHLQGQVGRRLVQGSRRRLRRRHHLVHDFLHGFPAGRPEVREVQRGRRLPAGRSEERKPGVPHRRRGLGIPSGVSKEVQLAAATFLKFMTEPENTAQFSAATGYMPTRTSPT